MLAILIFLSALSAPLNDSLSEQKVETKQELNLSFIQQYLPKNPIVVEAGARDGRDTLKMAKFWKNGRIYAFEPSPRAYRTLQKRCGKKKNVKAYSIALGSKIGYAHFYESREASEPQGFLLKLWPREQLSFEEPFEAATTTLDAWAEANQVKRIDFLLLDSEVNGMQMLKASTKILKTVRIIQARSGNIDEMKRWLEKEGFSQIDDSEDPLFVRKV